MNENIEYKFNESKYLKEAKDWIDGTYSSHYAGRTQATDTIVDSGHGTGFIIGNIIKLSRRYGKKDGYNRKDLLKIIHYSMLQLWVQDNGFIEGGTIAPSEKK